MSYYTRGNLAQGRKVRQGLRGSGPLVHSTSALSPSRALRLASEALLLSSYVQATCVINMPCPETGAGLPCIDS